MKTKFLLGITLLAVGAMSAAVVGTNMGNTFNFSHATDPNLKACGEYVTDEDWNVSYSEVVEMIDTAKDTETLDGHEEKLVAASEIIAEASSSKGQYYYKENNKSELPSLKFGTASAKGELTLTLTKKIDAIGFYADAYRHANDTDGTKTLTVNGIETKVLGASYTYDIANEDQRFFVEFESPVNEITIESTVAGNNRFHLYSIGFYSKSNFPDADVPVKYTVSFDSNGGTGTMTDVKLNEGSIYELPTCTFTAPEGYEFDYWAVNDVKQEQPITIVEDIVLVAHWKEKVAPVGDNVTILPSDGEAVTNADFEIVKDGVTVSVAASTLTADQIRVFKGKTLTLSVATGNIVQIEFICTASGTAKYGPGCFTVAEGSYSFAGTVGTWTGNAESVQFTASSNQVRITQIVVTISE